MRKQISLTIDEVVIKKIESRIPRFVPRSRFYETVLQDFLKTESKKLKTGFLKNPAKPIPTDDSRSSS